MQFMANVFVLTHAQMRTHESTCLNSNRSLLLVGRRFVNKQTTLVKGRSVADSLRFSPSALDWVRLNGPPPSTYVSGCERDAEKGVVLHVNEPWSSTSLESLIFRTKVFHLCWTSKKTSLR